MRAIVGLVLLIGAVLPGAAVAGQQEDWAEAAAAYGRGEYATALGLLRPSADQGYAPAQNSLGVMYADGRGVPKDEAEAVHWFRKAAEQGLALAQDNLGVMYRDGRGLAQDNAEAAQWFRKAAEQGYAEGQNNLGIMYETGRGVTKDEAEAVKWYRQAAAQGLARAQNNLGARSETARRVAKDDAATVTRQPNASGDGPARVQAVTESYEKGVAAYDQGQFATAFKLWLPIAEQGYAAAQFNLGALYEQGSGVAQDPAAAASWYLRAAQQGDPESQYKLGVMYETGRGVAPDLDEARRWYMNVIANPRAKEGSSTTKASARQRLANLTRVTEDVIPYVGGRFVIARLQDGDCVIALQGVVSLDASLKFDEVAKKSNKSGCNKPWLLLESPGGSLDDGFSLGKEVRSQGFRTITRYECASACSMIFLGGIERVLVGSRAKIGLHQPATIRGLGNERRCVVSMDSDVVRELRRYLRSTIPESASKVLDLIMQTSCDAIDWKYGQHALELGIATRLDSEGVDVVGAKQPKP